MKADDLVDGVGDVDVIDTKCNDVVGIMGDALSNSSGKKSGTLNKSDGGELVRAVSIDNDELEEVAVGVGDGKAIADGGREKSLFGEEGVGLRDNDA